MLATVADLLFC